MATNYFQVDASASIYKFECPTDAKSVYLSTCKDRVCDLTSISKCGEHILFENNFNQKI